MKIQDLRIGSYVNIKNRNNIDYCEVIGLSQPGLVHVIRNFKNTINKDDRPENIEDIIGIPMSEEWAKNLGGLKIEGSFFDNDGEEITFYKFKWGTNGTMNIHNSVHYKDGWEVGFGKGFKKIFHFVHEFQNIFTAHTCDVLQIKDIKKKIMKIKEFEMFLDGGTIKITTDEGIFCFDHRIGTATEGRLYDDIRKDDNSNLIENSEELENRIIESLKLFNDDFYQSSIDELIKTKQDNGKSY